MQLHVHWGLEGRLGSEHWFEGDQYTAEMHLVTTYKNKEGKDRYVVFARLAV